MMAGFLAGPDPKSGVIRRPFGSAAVAVFAMVSCLALASVRIVSGLKIRVSAVRFCPWPLSSNHNARRWIGAFGRSVAARVRFGGWRGIWRDSERKGPTRAEQKLWLPQCGRGAPVGSAEWVRDQIVSGVLTRERCCDTKARFAIGSHAEKAKGDLEARHGDPGKLVTYPCPFCGGWHLATSSEFR